MHFEEYRRHDATGLAALVKKGEVTAAELLELAVGRAREVERAINAISVSDLEHAERALATGLPQGPFHGVPFLLKDLYAFLAGTRLTNGSRLLEAFVCPADNTYVARCKAAGLVIFGKTNSPEFGLNVTTEPVAHGPTRNPWDRGRSAGGSSGGAAAAVAAGIVPMAQATDGGGSIRIPAAACGLVGLKPSRARNDDLDRRQGRLSGTERAVLDRVDRLRGPPVGATCGRRAMGLEEPRGELCPEGGRARWRNPGGPTQRPSAAHAGLDRPSGGPCG
jgi:amidase